MDGEIAVSARNCRAYNDNKAVSLFADLKGSCFSACSGSLCLQLQYSISSLRGTHAQWHMHTADLQVADPVCFFNTSLRISLEELRTASAPSARCKIPGLSSKSKAGHTGFSLVNSRLQFFGFQLYVFQCISLELLVGRPSASCNCMSNWSFTLRDGVAFLRQCDDTWFHSAGS